MSEVALQGYPERSPRLRTPRRRRCSKAKDAVKSYRPIEVTFHEPLSREIRDGFAGTSQRTAVVPDKAPGAARASPSKVKFSTCLGKPGHFSVKVDKHGATAPRTV